MAMINIYRSTDSGAPVLSASAGSMIALLDACLVNGYGSKTPAGWTKAYTGTNKAAYRMPATDLLGTTDAVIQAYLRVDDTNATYAVVAGFETMSDVDTGTQQFPVSGTTAWWAKYETSGQPAWSWTLHTDGLMVYLRVQNDAASSTYKPSMVAFGQYVSLRGEADVSPLLITYQDSAASNSSSGFAYAAGGYNALSRMYSGDGVVASFHNSTGAVSEARGLGVEGWSVGSYYFPYPGLATTGFVAEPYYIDEIIGSNRAIRGYWPGVYVTWEYMTDMPVATVFSDVHGAPGRTLELANASFGSYAANWLFDVTGPWR